MITQRVFRLISSKFTKEPKDFEYSLITPEFEDQALDLLADTYIKHDLLTVHLNFSSQQILKEFGKNILDSYKGRKLSTLCIHKPTSELCGITLSYESNPNYPGELSKVVSDSFGSVFAIFDELCNKFSDNDEKKWEKLLQIGLIAVKSEWKGNQITQHLVKKSEELARNEGLKYVESILTSPISQHVLIDQLNYTNAGIIKYNGFEFKGEKPFSGLDGHCMLAYKILDN